MMNSSRISLQETLTLIEYFNVRHSRLFDIKSGFPLPLLSCCIHQLLPADLIGFNDPPTQALRDSLQVIEKETCTFVPTGSHSEGLQINFFTNPNDVIMSDTDMFIIPKYGTLPAVDKYEKGLVKLKNRTNGSNFQNSYPGFVIITPKDQFVPLKKCLEDVEDFDQYTKQTIKSQVGNLFNKGPSIKAEATYVDKYNNKLIGDSDFVYAFPSADWPNQASEWLNRDRIAKWPSENLVRNIVALGTHYVKKPPPDVDESIKDYYWRISFSFAERELAKSFNDTQRQCAILLKLLKEKEIVPSEVLSSYHMKTIMYWACEEIPEKYWKPSRLGHCFLLVINRLYMAVVMGNLPHYFIPELNLIANKPKCTLMTILKCLQRIRKNPLHFISASLKSSFSMYYVKQKIEGITEPTEAYFETQMMKDFSKTFPNLLIICAALLKITSKRFPGLTQLAPSKGLLHHIEESAEVLGSALTHNMYPYKQLYMDVIEMAVLVAFDETDVCSYFVLLKNMKTVIETMPIEASFSPSLLYGYLKQKHGDNRMLFTTKMMFPMVTALLGL